MAAPRKKASRKSVESETPIAAIRRTWSWKWFIGVVGGATALLVFVITYEKAHPIIEPGIPVLRGYMREHTADVTNKTFEPISKWVENYDAFRLEQTKETTKLSLVNLEQNLRVALKELAEYPNSPSVQATVSSLKKEVADTRKRIEDYEAAIFAKRAGR